MGLVVTDVLEPARGLSPSLSVIGIVAGLLLWGGGWWARKFWTVLGATVIGGLVGLYEGPRFGLQPMVGGLICAVSFGGLALPLFRLAMYFFGGSALYMVGEGLVPGAVEPIVWILLGGLIGLWLHRLLFMFLTSLVGITVSCYSTLILLDKMNRLDMLKVAEKNTVWLNVGIVSVACLGILVQFAVVLLVAWQREWASSSPAPAPAEEKEKEKKEKKSDEPKSQPKQQGWFAWTMDHLRQAG